MPRTRHPSEHRTLAEARYLPRSGGLSPIPLWPNSPDGRPGWAAGDFERARVQREKRVRRAFLRFFLGYRSPLQKGTGTIFRRRLRAPLKWSHGRVSGFSRV